MKKYIARRLLLAIPTLVGVSLLIFFIMAVIPGDVALAILGEGATQEGLATLREQMGLTDPWYERYGRWVKDMATFGDLGESIFMVGVPINKLIAEHFPVTLNLAIYTTIIAVVAAVPLGTISAIRHDTWVDYVMRVFSIVGLSVPVFWLGMMILLAMVRWFGWTPAVQWVSPFDDFPGNFKQMIWPSLALGYFQVAFIARMTRSSLLDVLYEDYMRTARAKGLRETAIIVRHGLRNAVIPIVTIGGLQFVALLVRGVFTRDYPLIQTMIFMFACIVIVANLMTDTLYAWLDPRIRYQ